MRHSAENAAIILNEAKEVFAKGEMAPVMLHRLWVSLCSLHSFALSNDVRTMIGDKVFGGPFKGMHLTPAVLKGNFSHHLLGCYEHELHPTIEKVIAEGYARILNIGCSFGFYTVGLALRMPNTKFESFDIDENARQKCLDMVRLNQVEDRVTIGGEFRGEDFAKYLTEKTLVFMDIEGAEINLLNPEAYPALKMLDIIVEMHDLFNPQISKVLQERFSATHDFEFIMNKPSVYDFSSILGKEAYVDPFDALLVAWEGRDGPTPWGIFRTKIR